MNSLNTTTPRPARRTSLRHQSAYRAGAHVVQFYKEDGFLLDAVSGFVGAAIISGEAAIVVATQEHREALEVRLASRGLDLAVIRETGRYVPLDAEEALSSFIVGGQPEATRFFDLIGGYIGRAAEASEAQGRRVAVFGEIVALLWARGEREAAVRLEVLWNQLLAQQPLFHLHCAYPLAGFDQKEDGQPFLKICGEHSSVVPGEVYSAASEEQRLRAVAELQQKVEALEHESLLRHSEERFHLLVDSVKDYAIFMLDPAGIVTSWNAGAERIKGYSAAEITGKHFSVFYSPEDTKAGKPELALQTASTEGRFETEGWRIRKDSSRFWAMVTITALRDDLGNLKGFVKVTRDLTERKRMEDSLRELSGRLLSVQDEERRRLARELHDSTAQMLTALSLNLATLGRQVDLTQNQQASKTLSDSLTLAEEACRELRSFSYLLHPPLLDEKGLTEALRWYIDGFEGRTKIKVDLRISHEIGRLPREVETALFRVVQESLTNVYRHSGSPTAGVELDGEPDAISLVIWDRGKGIPEEILGRRGSQPSVMGVGLQGMRERMTQLGGVLTVKSGEPGTIIEVKLAREVK